MKIAKDTVFFDASDFAEISDGLRQSLTAYVGKGTSIEQFFSDRLNDTFSSVNSLAAQALVPALTQLAEAYTAADPATAASVKSLVDQARVLLGVSVTVGLSPETPLTPEEKPSTV